jgi:hypothetical protein
LNAHPESFAAVGGLSDIELGIFDQAAMSSNALRQQSDNTETSGEQR